MKLMWKIQRGLKLTAFLICALAIANTQVFAHARTYVWTEIYRTMPKGGGEIESWTTFKMPNGNKTAENSFTYKGEIEYGITDHWTIAHSQAWQTSNKHGVDDDGINEKDSTFYDGFAFETKYRLGERGKYWLDPLIYLEWEREPKEFSNPNKIEGKLVLSKDFGKVNFSYNQILESRLGRGGRTEHNYSIGSNYELIEGLHLGGELKGNYWHPSDHKNEIALGPTIAYEGQYFWVTAGVAWAVNKHTDDVQARLIVGVPF